MPRRSQTAARYGELMSSTSPPSSPAPTPAPPRHAGLRSAARLLLAAFLLTAGIGHFVAPEEFLAQTPTWLPARMLLVYVSGAIEIALAVALVGPAAYRRQVGWIVAAFFVVIFPGNIHQAVAGNDAFGLTSDAGRLVRLGFQPVLVVWALWSTAAWPPRRRQSTPART